MGFREDLMTFLENYEETDDTSADIPFEDEAEDEAEEAPETEPDADGEEEAEPMADYSQEEEIAALRAIIASQGIDADAALDRVAVNRKGEILYLPDDGGADAAPESERAPKPPPKGMRKPGRRAAHNGKVDLSKMTIEERAKFAERMVADDAAGRSTV